MYSQASVFLPFWAPQGDHVIVGLGLHAYRIRILRCQISPQLRSAEFCMTCLLRRWIIHTFDWSASIAFSLSITRIHQLRRFLCSIQNGKVHRPNLLWPPCVTDADIIFSSCGFFFFLLFLFFRAQSQRTQSGCLPYFYTWCGAANLECKSEMCRTRLPGNTGRKNHHLRTSHNFVGLYLRK